MRPFSLGPLKQKSPFPFQEGGSQKDMDGGRKRYLKMRYAADDTVEQPDAELRVRRGLPAPVGAYDRRRLGGGGLRSNLLVLPVDCWVVGAVVRGR